jgi:hypothetical protein
MRGGFWAVLALLAAAVASGCSGSAGPSSAGRTVAIVPWIGQPAPPYNPPAPRVVPYATAPPPCRAGQLGVRQERMGVGLGNVLERVAFLNLGERPCLLRGFPKVTGVTTTRVRRPVPARRSSAGTYFGHLVPTDIAPGDAASSTSPRPTSAGIRGAAPSGIGPSRSCSRPAEASSTRPLPRWQRCVAS